jgi:DNA-binding phage protein
MEKLTKKKVEEAIRASRGVLAVAARALGVSRQGLYFALDLRGLHLHR